MAGALEGIRVLVTRPSDRASQFEHLLEQRGATVTLLPLIGIGPPPSERHLQDAIDRAHTFDWLVFTSAAGVDSFARRGSLPSGPPRLAAVGTSTARAIEESLGRNADLVPTEFSGEALADALIAKARTNERILILAAQDARPALAARLRAAGFAVEEVPAYSTIELNPPGLEQYIAQSDVVALASPSAVKSLVRALGERFAAAKLRGKLLACIGPVTLFEARQSGLHVEVVPESATLAKMVDALCSYYTAHPSPP